MKLKKNIIWGIVLLIVILLGVSACGILSLPPFGGEITGERLKRVQAKQMFPVHWGTFNLAYHDWDEPIKRTLQAALAQQIDLVTPRVGDIVFAKQAFPSQKWWEAVK